MYERYYSCRGGTGKRLYPLTKITNNYLLPVDNYSIIFYSVHKPK